MEKGKFWGARLDGKIGLIDPDDGGPTVYVRDEGFLSKVSRAGENGRSVEYTLVIVNSLRVAQDVAFIGVDMVDMNED